MKTVYIFHDAFNDQFSDWYPWMKTELEKLGYVTFVPSFPTPAAQTYESWKAVIKNFIETFDEETLFIGHGIGGTFALRLIEELSQKIKGVVLVASYAEPIGHVGYDRINQTFVEHDFSWQKIKNNCYTIAVIAGENDPFVPLNITENLGKNLGEQIITIPDGGHINRASGFTQAIPLIDIIKQSLQSIDKSITVEKIEDLENESSPKEPGDALSLSNQDTLTEKSGGVVENRIASEKKPDGTIHTMYQDMSLLVNSNQGRVASSLLAEAREQEQIKKEASPTSWKNIFYLLGTLLILGAGIGALGYVFYQYLPAQQQPSIVRPVSLLPSETYLFLETENRLSFEIRDSIKKIFSEQINDETIKDIIFLNQGTRISFSSLVEKINTPTFPRLLAEQFNTNTTTNDPLFMYGIYQEDVQTMLGSFLIIPFFAYDTLFIGMNQWEPTLVRDLGIFMGLRDDQIQQFFSETVFEDEIIFNKPTRVYRDDSGTFILGYFFLNQRTIVFINKPELIPLIIKRYANREIL